MDIKTAKRLEHFQTGIFAALNEKKEELIASGRTVYNLFVGTPDFPVGKHIQEALIEAAKDPDNFHYSLRDIPELMDAVKDYYQKRFGGGPLPARKKGAGSPESRNGRKKF